MAARRERVADRKAAAVALVSGALAGGEESRAELERLATSQPAEFRPQFASRLADARLDRSIIRELTSSLERTDP
jgi:hypothetical protein